MIGAALLGCTDADEQIEEVVEAPTPEQTSSTFPLESRLELVEGALADDVLHKLVDGNAEPLRQRVPSVGLVGVGALVLLLTGRHRQGRSADQESGMRRGARAALWRA